MKLFRNSTSGRSREAVRLCPTLNPSNLAFQIIQYCTPAGDDKIKLVLNSYCLLSERVDTYHCTNDSVYFFECIFFYIFIEKITSSRTSPSAFILSQASGSLPSCSFSRKGSGRGPFASGCEFKTRQQKKEKTSVFFVKSGQTILQR